MKYDYIIKNGTMVDFDRMETFQGDLYIKEGRLVVPETGEETSYEGIVDATGKYVVPGLVDEHAHWNYGIGHLGVNADMVCPNAGVTTAVDAGSCGVENFDSFYLNDIYRYTTEVLAYCHISDYGVVATSCREEDQNPAGINEVAIRKLFEKHPDTLRGLKVRLSHRTLQYGMEPLKKAIELAEKIQIDGHHCHVAVHVAELPADFRLEEVLDILRPGDVYTHLYQNLGTTIFDKSGNVKQSFWKAREKGILFSSGNGGKHWSISNLKQAYQDGFYPDIISSDIVDYNVYTRPGFHLLYAMATSLMAGMPPLQVLKSVTENPAKALGIYGDVGSLAPGSRADVAIFELQKRKVRFIDRFEGEETAEELFVPLMTFRNGKVVFRQIFFDGGRDFSQNLKNYV